MVVAPREAKLDQKSKVTLVPPVVDEEYLQCLLFDLARATDPQSFQGHGGRFRIDTPVIQAAVKRLAQVTGLDVAARQQVLGELKSALKRVEQSPAEASIEAGIPTSEVVGKFLDSKRNDLAEGSLVKYSGSFKTFAKAYPYLPMTPEAIEIYLAARPASSSKRYLYALLTELYEFAHERLDIPNVMEKIKRPRKGKSKESDYLTLEQLKILLGAIQDDRERGMAWLMSGLGFRRSEVHRANVDDVFDDKIRVHGKEAEEWLPLLPETRDLLLKQAAGRSGKQPLFVTRTTGRRVGVDQINKIVNRLFKQAGVNSVRPSPHTLRHTYCTLMQAAGCDRISVELLMRHRTQNTTDIYTHISPEQRLELLRPKLERFSPIRLANGHKPSITGNNR
jgi:integrase/recombinase XerD